MPKISIAAAFLATVEMRPHYILESEIAALRRRWNTRKMLVSDIRAECELMHDNGPYTITEGQTKKGRDFWRNKIMTPAGKRRNDAFTKDLSGYDFGVLANITKFEFVRWHEQTNNYGQLLGMSPIYRAFGEAGEYVDYVASAWQSGGVELC